MEVGKAEYSIRGSMKGLTNGGVQHHDTTKAMHVWALSKALWFHVAQSQIGVLEAMEDC